MKMTIILLYSLIAIIPSNSGDNLGWNLVTEKSNIAIYNTQENGKKFKSFKVNGQLETDLNNLREILTHTDLLVQWFPMASEAKVISNTSNSTSIHMKFNFPFPLKNRDAFIDIIERTDAKNRVIFTMKLSDDFLLTNGFERIKNLESTTILVQSNNKTIIDQITYLDPGGNIPKMFLNKGLPKSMMKSFRDLTSLALKNGSKG